MVESDRAHVKIHGILKCNETCKTMKVSGKYTKIILTCACLLFSAVVGSPEVSDSCRFTVCCLDRHTLLPKLWCNPGPARQHGLLQGINDP